MILMFMFTFLYGISVAFVSLLVTLLCVIFVVTSSGPVGQVSLEKEILISMRLTWITEG